MKTQKMFQPCPICGNIKNPHSKVCGLCAGKGRKSKPAKLVELKCNYCKETFYIPEWRYNQGRGSFCSKQCKDSFLTTIKGKDHPKYTGKLVPGPYKGTSWKEARQAVIKRANGKCEWCGIDFSLVKRTIVHHHIGVYKFSNENDAHTPDNLSAICQSCHAKYHKLGKMPEGITHEQVA